MTRSTPTSSEKRIIDRLPEILDDRLTDWEIDASVTDAPDIVIDHADGRLGIEVSRLDYEPYCKWLAVPPGENYSRAAEITINLKKMLRQANSKKRKKYREYKRAHGLDECWLALHNNIFEFTDSPKKDYPDIAWFVKNAQLELQDAKCPYDRVFFNLEHPSSWYEFYSKNRTLERQAVITSWPTMIYRESAVRNLEPTVYRFDMFDNIDRDEFT